MKRSVEVLRRACAPFALVAFVAAGCVERGVERTVEVSPPRPYVGDEPRFGAAAAERFGLAGTGPALEPTDAAAAPAFDFDLPAGWSSRPPSSMRAVDLRVDREPSAMCTLTLLAGDGGGLRANVDRWLGQFGLAPIAPAEFDALERAVLLGRDAVRIDIAGDYSGMGSESHANFRLLGVLAVAAEGSAFLKFVGPAQLVADEARAFDAVVASLRVRAAAASVAATESTSDGRLRYTAPAGWTKGPDRMLREVTFDIGQGVECYVSILGGDGGGVRSNFDRWRGQMGQPPLDTNELAALERIAALGTTAILIEIAGDFEGMGGATTADALMLGAVAELPGSTLFVKLVGPRAAASAERERFRAFVVSLGYAP